MVCQNLYNDFSWWHKNNFTTIFLLLYLLLPLRIRPTCHRDTHQVFTYLILSLHPPAPSFPTHKTFFLALEDNRKWMEQGAPEWRPGGADRPHHQADWPPPLGLYKHPPPTQFFAHTPAQKTSPSIFCSAASRERKLRKRVEKKSKGSLALNFSLTPLKALDTMFGRILKRTSSRANSQRSMSVDSQESPSPVSNTSPSASQSQGKILTNDVHLHIRRGEEKEGMRN
jgi:hypothetical protein